MSNRCRVHHFQSTRGRLVGLPDSFRSCFTAPPTKRPFTEQLRLRSFGKPDNWSCFAWTTKLKYLALPSFAFTRVSPLADVVRFALEAWARARPAARCESTSALRCETEGHAGEGVGVGEGAESHLF